jgi:hypothetical protein
MQDSFKENGRDFPITEHTSSLRAEEPGNSGRSNSTLEHAVQLTLVDFSISSYFKLKTYYELQ